MSETGEVIANLGNNNIMENSILLLKNLPSFIQKNSVLVALILLEKELFKISLLVLVLYILWVVLSSIELVVLRTLLPCL